MKSLFSRPNLKNLQEQIHIQQKNIIRFIKERRTIKVLHLFRNYSAFVVVLSSALLVSATNLSAGKESSGFLFGYLGNTDDNYENPIANKMSIQTEKKTDLALVPLAQASLAPDPSAKQEEANEMILQDQSMVASMSPVRIDPEENGGVKIYEVKSGDTISSIAVNFHITVNTIMWANNLDNIDSIMPGDKIFILPVSGLSYTVKNSDTIDSIADKFKAKKDEIIAFNNLPANGDLNNGQEIIIPNGQQNMPAVTPAPVTTPGTGLAVRPYQPFVPTPGKHVGSATGNGHSFPYGYCTWYVAQKRNIPWGGNAGTWLYSARSMGYSTGHSPRPGAIVVFALSRYGHVAIVESVSGGSFTISEMNFNAFAKKNFRVVASSDRSIKGFIY